jgi:hypothetical protein
VVLDVVAAVGPELLDLSQRVAGTVDVVDSEPRDRRGETPEDCLAAKVLSAPDLVQELLRAPSAELVEIAEVHQGP